jgi:hypothetical protein
MKLAKRGGRGSRFRGPFTNTHPTLSPAILAARGGRLVHYQYGSGDNESLNRLDAMADYASSSSSSSGGSATVFASYKYLGRSMGRWIS